MGNKTVLVTAIGAAPAFTVIDALLEKNYRVIGCDVYPEEYIPATKRLSAFYNAPYASDEDMYIEFIEDVIEKEKVDILLPLLYVEIDVICRNIERIEQRGVYIAISAKDEIDTIRDKWELYFKIKGLFNSIEDIEERGSFRSIPTDLASNLDFDNLTYPIVLKPRTGRSSVGLYRVRHEAQLGFALSNILSSDDDYKELEEYIVQPMIKGEVVTVDISRDGKGHMNICARLEKLRTRKGVGTVVKVFKDPILSLVCRKIADLLDIRGAANLEFIKGEGSGLYYFLECNPRFSNGVAFSKLAGINFAKDHIDILEGKSIEEIKDYKEGFLARSFKEHWTLEK